MQAFRPDAINIGMVMVNPNHTTGKTTFYFFSLKASVEDPQIGSVFRNVVDPDPNSMHGFTTLLKIEDTGIVFIRSCCFL